MTITHFHKLIQSRKFWICFTVLICLSMAGFGTYGMMANKSAMEKAAIAKVYGETVRYPEYQKARADVLVSYVLTFGADLKMTEEMDAMFDKLAWERIIGLRKAKQMNLTASDAEVVEAIQAQAAFQTEGNFDPVRYKTICGYLLPRFNMTTRNLEEIFRREIILGKLRRIPQQAALVSPTDIRKMFHLSKDKYKAEYAVLEKALVKDEVTVSDDQIRAFFEANKEAFRMPEKVRVKYVEFPVADFTNAVQITEQDAKEYYEANKDQYQQISSEQDAEPTYLPFEAVKTVIEERLLKNRAVNLAADKATELVMALLPKERNNRVDFDAKAEELGLSVKRLPAFAQDGELPGIDAADNFREAAFLLTDTPDEYFSDAVIGEEKVYVIALTDRIPSQFPLFEAVKENAREGALGQAVSEALLDKADEIYRKISESEDASFSDVLKSYGVETVVTPAFGMGSSIQGDNYAPYLQRAVAGREKGELATPIPAGEILLLVQVSDHIPADESTLPEMRDQLAGNLRQNAMRQLAEDWNDYLRRDSKFEDLRNR